MDAREKSFDTAIGSSKLMVTLCTAVVAFCIAIVNVKSGDNTIFTPEDICQKAALSVALLLLLLSIGGGAWTQLAMTHVLSEGTYQNPPDIWNPKVRFPFMIQIALFLLGLLVLAGYTAWKMFG